MHADRLQWAVLGGLIAVTVASAMTLREIAALGAAFQPAKGQPTMQTFTEVVTVTSDTTRKITVVTPRLDNETEAAWIARHNAAVTAAKGA
jgi:esterase/lipase